MERIEYRMCRPNELAVVLELERAYMYELEPEHLAKWEQSIDKTAAFFNEIRTQMIVAVVDNYVVGYTYWHWLNQLPHVYSLYTVPKYRGQGVAKELLRQIETQIRQTGNTLITLATLRKNPAQYLFLHVGYKKINADRNWLYYQKELL